MKNQKKWENNIEMFLEEFRDGNMKEFCSSLPYQALKETEIETYQQIFQLGLSKSQLKAIEKAFEAQAVADAAYMKESYLTGLSDAFHFIHYMKTYKK